MWPRIEYSVTVPVQVDVAFRAFLDLSRLLNREIYETVQWVESEPWQKGSRLRYELVRPVRTQIAAVVTSISPPRAVELLNHALGVTAEQHVSFGPDLHGGTRVRMIINLIGTSNELSENEVVAAANFISRDALDTMAAVCAERASSTGG